MNARAQRGGYIQVGGNDPSAPPPVASQVPQFGQSAAAGHHGVAAAVQPAYETPKRVHLDSCCCCIPLRVGMRIMLGLDIVGYVLAILLVYMGYAVLSSTSQLIGDNEDAQKIQDRLESLLYSNPTFWWSISVGVVGFACVCIGIAGMMRDELRLVKIYTNWRFAYIGLNALWTIIYLFSGLARSYAELTCDLLMPPPRGPGGTPSQALPGSGFGREECVSTTMASTYQSSLTGVAIGSLVGLYFAYCVLSFYNEMYNEHLARRQPQNNLQLVPLVQ